MMMMMMDITLFVVCAVGAFGAEQRCTTSHKAYLMKITLLIFSSIITTRSLNR